MEGVSEVLRGSNASLPLRRESMRAPNALWIPAGGDLLLSSLPPFCETFAKHPFSPLAGEMP